MENKRNQKTKHKTEETINNFFLSQKVKMLNFAERLKASDNDFLKEFSEHLKVLYSRDIPLDFKDRSEDVDDESWEVIPGGAELKKQYDALDEYSGDLKIRALGRFVEHLYFLPELPKSFSIKGCALLGDTPFDKLAFIQAFLEICGDVEYADDGIVKNRYAIYDCEGKMKKPETLESVAVKYKNVPLVIFNNCENILKSEDTLILFKHLTDGNRIIPVLNKDKNEFEDVIVKSQYVLLGNEDKLPELINTTKSEFLQDIYHRISTFPIKIINF